MTSFHSNSFYKKNIISHCLDLQNENSLLSVQGAFQFEGFSDKIGRGWSRNVIKNNFKRKLEDFSWLALNCKSWDSLKIFWKTPLLYFWEILKSPWRWTRFSLCGRGCDSLSLHIINWFMTTYYISYYTFPYVGSSLASIVKSYQDNFDDTLLNPVSRHS